MGNKFGVAPFLTAKQLGCSKCSETTSLRAAILCMLTYKIRDLLFNGQQTSGFTGQVLMNISNALIYQHQELPLRVNKLVLTSSTLLNKMSSLNPFIRCAPLAKDLICQAHSHNVFVDFFLFSIGK